jgi:hypothetical protein
MRRRWGKSMDRICICVAWRCQRKPTCCCTLHIPRLLSAVICFIYSSPAISILSRKTLRLAAIESLLLISRDFHDRCSFDAVRNFLSMLFRLQSAKGRASYDNYRFGWDLCRSRNWVSKAVDWPSAFFKFSHSSFSSLVANISADVSSNALEN